MSAEQIKPGYKRTEVGVIPESWSIRSLGELCDYQNGTALEAYFDRRDGFKVISIGNYGVTGQFVETGSYVAFEKRKLVEKFILHKNDLAMSLNDKTAVGAIIGRVLLIETDDSYVFNQRTMRLRPKISVSSSYLHYAINADQIHASIVGLAKPGTQIYVNTDDVLNLRLSIPGIDEQHAIATSLSDVDALLTKLDQLIAKKRNLKQATMQQLLTGQTRLPGFSGVWEVKRLGDVCRITTGKKDVNEGNPSGQYPFFTCARANTYSDSYSFDGEAILIAGNGEVGNLNYYNGKFEAYQRTYVLQSFVANLSFLWHQLSAFLVASLGIGTIGSSIPYIKMENLVGFEFHTPMNEGEQIAIATVLSDMDTELASLETRRDKTRALKQGMMQELLTGRVRLNGRGVDS